MLLLFSLLTITLCAGQDISSCCTRILLESAGEAQTHQRNRLGEYSLTGIYNERPLYTSVSSTVGDEFLFYLRSKNKGLWMVGPEAGQFNGGLAHRGDSLCVENVAAAQWKYTDGKSWKLDQQITVVCLDVKEEGELPSCLYEDQTAFLGSDLPAVFGGGGVETNTESSAECIDLCERTAGCNYWTWVMEEKVNCFLKSSLVKSERRPKHVSGSDPSACTVKTPGTTQQSPLPEDASYDENEINGKFKIMMGWDDKFKDPESEEYQDLANTIETDLEDMLRKERDLSEQVEEFKVTVQQFSRGSVVCDFKVNYILKEAYIAIPFAIKPSNITTAMGNNFKFKKGILFQRFLIAGGSFNASSPVDHCAAKGCSHKCNYDYGLEDYLCTCPPSLQLASDSRTCLEDREESSSPLPEIVVKVVPSDCLWSAWSDWSVCSVECGGLGKRGRTRTVEIPEKNGGSCLGRNQEFEQCEEICQDTTEGSPVEITTGAPEGRANPPETTTVSDEATERSSGAETAGESELEPSTTVRGGEVEVTTEAVEQGEEQPSSEEVKSVTDDVSATTTEEVATESPTEAETVKIIYPLPEDPTETTTEFGNRLGPVTEQTDVVMTTETINESVDTDMEVTTEKQEETKTTTETISAGTTLTIDGEMAIATTTLTTEDTVTTVASSEATTSVEKETESVENVDMAEISTIVVIEEEQTTVKTTTTTMTEQPTENELDEVTTSVTETTAGPKEAEDEFIPSKRPRLDDEDVDVETTTTEKAILTDETTTTEKVMDTVDESTTTEKTMETVEQANTKEKVMDTVDESTTTEKTLETVDDANTTEKVMDTVDETSTTEKIVETVDETATTEKVMNKIDESTTTEKTMETVDEATTIEKVMETIDETTTTEKILETVDETGTTEKVVDFVVEIATTKQTMETVDEASTTEKGMETIDETTTTERIIETVDETTTTNKIMETENELDEVTTSVTETTAGPDEAEDEFMPSKQPRLEDDAAVDVETTTTLKAMVRDETTTTEKIMDTVDESTTTERVVENVDETTSTEKAMETVDETTTTEKVVENVDETTTTEKELDAVEESITTGDTTTMETIMEYETTTLREIFTTMEVVAISESDDDMTVVTTLRPRLDEDAFTETPTTTTTMKPEQEEDERPDENFLCKLLQTGDDSIDLSLNCEHLSGDQEKSVMLLIPRDIIGDRKDRLFNKNVKIVVKDFMLMDRSPRRL